MTKQNSGATRRSFLSPVMHLASQVTLRYNRNVKKIPIKELCYEESE